MKAFYQLTKEEALQQLKTSPVGLNNKAVAALQQEFGENALQEANKKEN